MMCHLSSVVPSPVQTRPVITLAQMIYHYHKAVHCFVSCTHIKATSKIVAVIQDPRHVSSAEPPACTGSSPHPPYRSRRSDRVQRTRACLPTQDAGHRLTFAARPPTGLRFDPRINALDPFQRGSALANPPSRCAHCSSCATAPRPAPSPTPC